MTSIDTTCIHPFGHESNNNGGVTAAILPAVSYNYLDGDELQYPGFYSTYNQKRLAQIIATLEKGEWGMIFSSGMAAITTTLLTFVDNGDHIIFLRELYGGTLKFATEELPRRGITCSFATPDIKSFESLVNNRTRIIYIESPSNPLLNIISLDEIVSLARKHNIITVIDNTFASPINQVPLSAGFDFSIESGTKYLGGHNDLPFGSIACSNKDYQAGITNTARIYGGSLTPYECYLAERSLKTLAIRVRQQNSNAQKIAEFLLGHAKIDKVYFPGLTTHPQHQTARKQMAGFGGMISFELKADEAGIKNFQKNLQLITPALSLGGVESLISSPRLTSHRYLTATEREKLGIKDNLLRLSVGIEDAVELIDDITQAFEKIK
jgi:cystathionine beta-lyase/cystathionine gamma-synthase